MMKKQYFPDSLSEVPYLKRCEHKKKSSHVVVDEVDKSPEESTLDDDGGVVSLGLDPENSVKMKFGASLGVGTKVNVISLLSSPKSGRDFLVNSSGEQVKLILVTKMNPNTNTNTNTKIKKTEAATAFNTFVSAFPNCLAIPISDSNSYDRVSGFFGLTDALLLDPNGIVVTNKHLKEVMYYGAAAFPFTDDHYKALDDTTWKWLTQRPVPLENLLGLGLSDILYNSAGNTTAVSDLKHKLVGLYLYKSGDTMVAINSAYQYCQTNNLELDIVLVYLPLSDDPLHFISCTHAALRDQGISSWWLLPFDDSTSRRLWKLCDCSRTDELIIVGPQGEFFDSNSVCIVTNSCSAIKDMYPYATEAIARQETHRLNKLTLPSLFSKKKCRLLTQKGRRMSLKKLRGRIVFVIIVNFDSSDTLERIRYWCHENEGCKYTDTNFALVLVPFRSSKFNFTPNSSPNKKLSWLWDSTMPWLICPPDPVVEASIIKHTTFRGLGCPDLSFLTFGEDGKLLSIDCHNLSQIQANSFPRNELYELVLERYTEEFHCKREVDDCYY